MSAAFTVDGADLVTERLILRPLSTGDVRAVLDGARLAQWAEDFPDEGDHAIAGMLDGRPEPQDSGQRQVIERESGQVVGGIGLFCPPTAGTVEFGYGIVPSRRKRGYATEAARALVAFVFTDPSVHQVYAGVEGDNPASVRVLEKAGLRRISNAAEPLRYGVSRRPDLSAVQDYLRTALSPVTQVGPFVVHIDDHSSNPFRNYAVPQPGAAPEKADIDALVEEFRRRDRLPRLEYVSPVPAVDKVLQEAGFVVEQQLPLLTVDPADLRQPSQPDGIHIRTVDSAADLRSAAKVQNAAYGGSETTDHDVDRLRSTVDSGGVVALACRGTDAIGSGLHTAPRSGLSEIAAVGVAEAWRRRGIAAVVAHLLSRSVLDRGATPILQAGGAAEGRIYTRLGYRKLGDLTAISLPGGRA
ncbi:MAG TPA: GNAT family N-acetyltransferase [Mycobacteriales bacterium]|nr:GNAT family N-acetyltransferase [Mycobacteriales bacterium]